MSETAKPNLDPASQTQAANVRVETVRKLHLEPGDILQVTVGLSSVDMGDGAPPWIPTLAELEDASRAWEEVLPEGVELIVDHIGVQTTVVRP